MDNRGGDERFPLRYAAAFVVVALGLIGTGFALWLPARGGPSTAASDLGLALIGGGLALTGGFGVAVVVFLAERRFDRALRRREEAAERESLKLSLSMTSQLAGVDLRGRDLRGAFFRGKDLRDADLRQANLSGASISNALLNGALLIGADLRNAWFDASPTGDLSLVDADLTDADLRGATIRGDIRGAMFDSADLRGADLSRSCAVHPRPDNASDDEIASQAAVFDGAKYDAATRWPEGVDPEAVGAVRT